jgi:hypothetical protein
MSKISDPFDAQFALAQNSDLVKFVRFDVKYPRYSHGCNFLHMKNNLRQIF